MPPAPSGQGDGENRQKNGEAVGGGGEQIEKGVAHGGKGGHQRPGQGGEGTAADAQQRDGQGGGQGEEEHGEEADDRRHLGEAVEIGGEVEKPPAGDGHLLGVEDAAETVGVGDDVGKDVEVDQIARQKTAEKGRLLRGGDPGPQGFELVVQHVAGASRAAGAADLRKKRENHKTSYHNFHIL